MRLPDPDVDHETPLLLLMVKDEVLGIERPLRSAAAIGIRDVLLVDTGSTDGTVARAHALAAELSLAIAVAAIGWPGSFAAARNACLDLAAALYPSRQALFLDADDEVSGTWAGPLPGGHPEARAVTMQMGDTSWAMPRVIRLTLPLPHYEGAVHEILRLADPGWLSPSGLTVRHHAGKSSRARWEEDRVVLEKEWFATGSARALFYWAQTVECLANAAAPEETERREDLLDEALSLYERRAEILDTEEAFVAELRACRLRDDPRFVGQPSRALLSRRLALHDVFPSRPEPLVDAAWAALREERWPTAYLLAKAAQQCDPSPHALFLRRTARWNETCDILSRACLHVPGKLHEGVRITLQAARGLRPGVAPFDWPRHNLGLYRERLGIAEPFPEEDAAFVGGPPALELDDRVVPGRRDHRKGDAIVGGCHREAVAVGARGATNGEECAVSFDEQRRPLRRLPLIAKHCERIAPADRQRAAVPIKVFTAQFI